MLQSPFPCLNRLFKGYNSLNAILVDQVILHTTGFKMISQAIFFNFSQSNANPELHFLAFDSLGKTNMNLFFQRQIIF